MRDVNEIRDEVIKMLEDRRKLIDDVFKLLKDEERNKKTT